ncbi:hypothetical protein BST61_g10913 [Cercospora zeina]
MFGQEFLVGVNLGGRVVIDSDGCKIRIPASSSSNRRRRHEWNRDTLQSTSCCHFSWRKAPKLPGDGPDWRDPDLTQLAQLSVLLH